MPVAIDQALLMASILIFISLIAGKTSYRFGVPVLLFFLTIGMLAGSEGVGGIYFDDHKLAQVIGSIALNFILFSGGFETDWKSIKPIVWHGGSLSTLGVLLTAAFVGIFIHAVTDFSLYEGLLLGSIVSSTDSAAVFSILRSKNLALKGSLRPPRELESGSNDPMAYALTITFTQLVANPDTSPVAMAPVFLKQILIGIMFGFAIGFAGAKLFNRIRLDYEGMYPVLMIAIMLQYLELKETDTVLEIGTGSGYQSALLAELTQTVCTVERLEALSLKAQGLLKEQGYKNIHFRIGDGALGWQKP